MKILSVFGTRPEAIKMAPLVKALNEHPLFDAKVCVTGQHRLMLDQVLDLFAIKPDFDLDLMAKDQTLSSLTQKVLAGMERVYRQWRPDLTLVHGDTTSSAAAGLAAYYEKIAIGHVEAGLRTGDKYAPWPEEANRRITSVIADLHFAPTGRARMNLLNEKIPSHKVYVTGNTIIDALQMVLWRLENDISLKNRVMSAIPRLNERKKLILATGHRRENFGSGLENICEALAALAQRDDVEIVFSMHLNPGVREPAQRLLSGKKNIHLVEAMEYPAFIYLMSRSYLLLTDSGGVQEEGPALGKPVLVMRDRTERPEIIEAGAAMLTGADKEHILKGVISLLENQEARDRMARVKNPYGDGLASKKIIEILERYKAAQYGI